jgi:mono/diheme cytochrome c family protein
MLSLHPGPAARRRRGRILADGANPMNRLSLFGAGVMAAAALTVSTSAYAQGGAAGQVERGRYLVQITGCHDCHSPKIEGMTPDLKRSLSGRPGTTPLPTAAKGEVHASLDLTAWQGPWGSSVASNLTPDPATGIGTRYNEASFITTMRAGKKPNGTMILPPMPSDVYKNMTDDDLKAIFAYLRTIPAIRNAVYAGITPAPAPK